LDRPGRFQREGILSKTEAEPLHYKTPFQFTEAELDQLHRFSEFPEGALQRLAGDQDRNTLIVDRVRKAARDGPVLFFANSVEHAQHLAARLCLQGAPAASIYADTDTAVRQYFVRQFLDGGIKVLANYQVLATGFDAPKTATILISRRYSARCAICKWSAAECVDQKTAAPRPARSLQSWTARPTRGTARRPTCPETLHITDSKTVLLEMGREGKFSAKSNTLEGNRVTLRARKASSGSEAAAGPEPSIHRRTGSPVLPAPTWTLDDIGTATAD
jgi:hypothetical protein